MPDNNENKTTGHAQSSNKSSRSELSETSKQRVTDLMSQNSFSALNVKAESVLSDSKNEFISMIMRLLRFGDKARLALAFLLLNARKKGHYLLFGYTSIVELAVAECMMSRTNVYRYLNAAESGLLVCEQYDELPLVVLEHLSKVTQKDPERQAKLLAILDRAAEEEGGITEDNVLDAIKALAPTGGNDDGKSERVRTMEAVIKAKDATLKALGDPKSFDEAKRAKVDAFKTAAQDLLSVC